jgi:hypothetical protein
MDGTNFALVMSSLCLVLLFALARDVPTQAVDGKACVPLVDDAYKPIENPLYDMNCLVLRLASTSLTNSSTVLSLSNIYAQGK